MILRLEAYGWESHPIKQGKQSNKHATDCQRIKLMMTQPKKNTFSWLCNLVSLKIELFSFPAKVYPVMNPSKIAYKKKNTWTSTSKPIQPILSILGSKKSMRQMLKNLPTEEVGTAHVLSSHDLNRAAESHTQEELSVWGYPSDHRHSPVFCIESHSFSMEPF